MRRVRLRQVQLTCRTGKVQLTPSEIKRIPGSVRREHHLWVVRAFTYSPCLQNHHWWLCFLWRLCDLVGIRLSTPLAPTDNSSRNTGEPLWVHIPDMDMLELALRHLFPRHWLQVDKQGNLKALSSSPFFLIDLCHKNVSVFYPALCKGRAQVSWQRVEQSSCPGLHHSKAWLE